MLLSDLIDQLESEVPAVDGVPTDAQYEQAIKDAVREFSRRCGRIKFGQLSIVSGTATYDLPADFLKMVVLHSAFATNGIINSPAGLIPVPADFCEQYTIVNGQITFKPTPAYSMTRDFKYQAAWILSIEDEEYAEMGYADMGEDEAQIVLLKAKSLAKEKLMNSIGSGGTMKYSLGAVSIDKSSSVDTLSKEVYALTGEFVTECEKYNGTHAAYGGG